MRENTYGASNAVHGHSEGDGIHLGYGQHKDQQG